MQILTTSALKELMSRQVIPGASPIQSTPLVAQKKRNRAQGNSESQTRPFQIKFTCRHTGRYISSTKRKLTWYVCHLYITHTIIIVACVESAMEGKSLDDAFCFLANRNSSIGVIFNRVVCLSRSALRFSYHSIFHTNLYSRVLRR